MIRRVYWDFIRDKLSKNDIEWLVRRGLQYWLIHASYLVRRPLCGPALGTLVTNYRCNYHCRMCDMPVKDSKLRNRGLKELSTHEMKQLLKEFADLGTPGIGFTGGEPLLRKDIFELLKHAKDLGMVTHLNTNGYLLNKKTVTSLLGARVDSINVSLDGACAETHDKIRGHPGAFDRVIKGVELIKAERRKAGSPIRLKLVTVLNETNIVEAPDILELACDLQVDCYEVIPQQPFREDHELIEPGYDHDFLSKVRRVARRLVEFDPKRMIIENSQRHLRLFEDSFGGRRSPVACYAGYNSYGVDCYGEIYPCVPWINWEKSVGNVRDMPLAEFWYSKKYNSIRDDISRCRDCYLNCQAELNLLFSLGRRRG